MSNAQDIASEALTPEEYAEYRRLQAKVMAEIGRRGLGGRKGGQSRSEAKQEASRTNGKKGGRPRLPDNELKRPRRKPKE